MNIEQQTSAQCASAAPSKSGEQFLSNVYASRRGRSPSEPKGMANADTVMARLESGLPLKDALMPGASYDGWHSHCKLFPEWAAKAKALVERNAEAGKVSKLEKLGVFRKRAMTHCKRGHEFTPENTLLRKLGRECKACKIEQLTTRGPSLSPAQRAKVIEAMRRGLTYWAMRKLVDMNAFYRTRRRDPEFDAICREWASGARKRMLRRKVAKNGRQQYEWILALIPQHLPRDHKDEIVGLVIEAHKRRTFRKKPFGIRRTKERMKEFVSEFYRQNPTQAYGGIDSPWSLDAPIGRETDTKLGETVSEGLW
ncbi:hypothetical protein EDE08_113222 [Bradyrhizobium sp. R2.2-H]|jgi:hypothetical protein|uniref:hypothetical protein n=1 Tax=unclassified Bradyrhizobium TaxID=2631580 RepID=UPI00104B76D0|nr:MULTISPECIES: hypothetical protein [unclassified Bradyrhizobium]TCU65608.1 hypothetical protein EDE10_113222 [Bradyrhizobium sp. Y-H1]TCU67755.1 hypothetical protein EDE08_113222 [Bradyrhizobium sp. R2.2-H]